MESIDENTLLARWNGQTAPLLSIVCLTYNHAAFIRQALDGFLMQETRFPFEIIVHDDASTDETPTIIAEYAARFPTIIKPILQQQNQFSLGVPFATGLFARAAGNTSPTAKATITGPTRTNCRSRWTSSKPTVTT